MSHRNNIKPDLFPVKRLAGALVLFGILLVGLVWSACQSYRQIYRVHMRDLRIERKDGHGFGLHSGALAAKQMGGSLSVHSDDVGHGATFTLELPSGAASAEPVSKRTAKDGTVESL